MMNSIAKFFTWSHLVEIPDSIIYRDWLLYFLISFTVLLIALFIFLKFKKRSVAYLRFDRLWLWGYLGFNLVGLFIWFAVDQALPNLGTRMAVLVWLFFMLSYGAFLLFYFRTKTKHEVISFHEKKRKQKYLK